jgi:transcriptional regulator with XRE-family HTH domain
MTCATTPYTGPSGLGIYIRKQRRERGWDVVDLARKAGLNRKLIYRIENGSTRTASPRNLRKLADVFDMSVADLEASGEASEHGNDTGENHRS